MAAARPDPNAMKFLEHLDELRRRLFVSAVAVALGFAGGWVVHDHTLRILMAPVQANLPEGFKPVFTTLAEPFLLAMKVSFFVGLIAALPVVVLQTMLVSQLPSNPKIAPQLQLKAAKRRKERRVRADFRKP